MRWAVLVAVASIAAALLGAPAVVNGDGLGYLKASLDGSWYPGHLGYLPLLRLLRAGTGPRVIDGLFAARALSAASGGLAVLALAGTARRLFPSAPRAPLVAAGGLAVSFGAFAAASDVESYAPALAALCLATYGAARRSATIAALFTVAAALLHIENVLLALPLFIALRGRERALYAAGVTLGLGAAYGAAAVHFGPAWLLGASHGFGYPLRLATPAIAVYGACKSLVYSPYPYEASWPRVILCFLLGASALLALFAALTDHDRRAPFSRAATLAWLLPYSLVGALFFPSDSERWVFLLPLLWLTVASSPRAAGKALIIAALIAIANAILWLPIARDSTFRDRAHAAAIHLHPGDLVISPGHGWDEYLGIYDGPPVDHYPLVFHAARLGTAAALRTDLSAAITRARAAGHSILLARFHDDDSPLGWKELARFGITPTNVADLLPATRQTDLGHGLWRLDPDGDGIK